MLRRTIRNFNNDQLTQANLLKTFKYIREGFMESKIQRVPLLLTIAFTVKLLTSTLWSYPDALVLLVLAGCAAVFEMNLRSKDVKNIALKMEQYDKELQKLKEDNEKLSSQFGAIKIANNVKQVGMKF